MQSSDPNRYESANVTAGVMTLGFSVLVLEANSSTVVDQCACSMPPAVVRDISSHGGLPIVSPPGRGRLAQMRHAFRGRDRISILGRFSQNGAHTDVVLHREHSGHNVCDGSEWCAFYGRESIKSRPKTIAKY